MTPIIPRLSARVNAESVLGKPDQGWTVTFPANAENASAQANPITFAYFIANSSVSYSSQTPCRVSIQESEKPKGNLITDAYFRVIIHDKGIGYLLDLSEALSFAANFKQGRLIDHEVPFFGGRQDMSGSSKLIDEKVSRNAPISG